MQVSCGDCNHQFYLRGNALETIVGGGGCENCGGRNLYRQVPSPVESEMTERNMPLDGKHPDTGGNPLQEGILADDGWEPDSKRDESFAASVKTADMSGMQFDFGGFGPEVSHTVIVGSDGRVHTAAGQVAHAQVADQHGLHRHGFPNGMSLGHVNDDGSTSWWQHDSGLQPQQLASAIQSHLGSNYGLNVPVTVDPNLKPSSNVGRWFGDQSQIRGPAPREMDILNGPALPRPYGRPPIQGEKEWALRGGSVNTDTLNLETYTPWEHQADVLPPAQDPSGLYSAEATPGQHGIHSGTIHWLNFFNAHVNGLNARDQGKEIFAKYGDPRQPEWRQPVTVSVHHPGHLPAVVESIEQSAQGNRPTPETARVGQAIQAGQIPWPPGMGPQNITRQGAIAPLIPAIVEGVGVGAAAEGAGAAGAAAAGGEAAGAAGAGAAEAGGINVNQTLMKGAIQGAGSHEVQGLLGPPDGGGGGAPAGGGMIEENLPAPPVGMMAATHEADIPGKIDTPSSVPRMPTTDDPEAVDPHELNDGTQAENFYGDGADAGGSQAPPNFDADDLADIGMHQDKLLHYYHSPESGLQDPDIRALHERLETKHPGYLGYESPDQSLQPLHQPPGVTAAMLGQQPGQFPVQPGTGTPMQQGQQTPWNQQMTQGGTCAYCGGVTLADGSCPQCGAKQNPMGGQLLHGQPGGGPTQAPISSPPSPVASVHTADSPGPVTPEQRAAVADLLVQEGRDDEIPNMEQQPWLYARELARVKHDPNKPPEPVDPSQVTPPAPAQEVAPPGATMPVPDPSQQMAASRRSGIDDRQAICPQCKTPSLDLMSPNENGFAVCRNCGYQHHGLGDDYGDHNNMNHQYILENAMPVDTNGIQPMYGNTSSPSQQIAAAVARFSADSYAPRCPRCGSASTGFQDAENVFCHSCGKNFTTDNVIEQKTAAPEETGGPVNVPSAPAADQMAPRDVEQEQDSSLSWQDASGQPLQTGQTYYMHSPQYEVPDLVRVEKVKPDGITLTNIGEVVNPHQQPGDQGNDTLSYTYEISREEFDMDGLSFEPESDSQAPDGFSDQQNNVQDVPPAPAPQSQQVQTSSLNAESGVLSCPECGNSHHIVSSMTSPTTVEYDCYRCAHTWEVKDEDESVTAGLQARSWLQEDDSFDDDWLMPQSRMASGGQSRSLADAASRDPRYQQVKEMLDQRHQERVAGQKFTPREKREFIDEDGVARNSNLLELGGTHYETRPSDGWSRADMVPDDHLGLGL